MLDDYFNENKERQDWMRTFLKFERSLVDEETNQAMRDVYKRQLVWYAIVVLVNHDVIGTGQFHLRAISEAVWSHGQFAQRRVLFRLEDVTSASPCQMCIRDRQSRRQSGR